MGFTFGRAVTCPLPEVTANNDIFLKLDLILLNLKGAVLSDSPSKAHLAAISACNCTLKIFFFILILTRFFNNFISVKGIPVFWVMALVCALLLKVRLIVMYSLTHLSMKFIRLLLWLLPVKIQSLRTSTGCSLYILCISWTKLFLPSTHNFFVSEFHWSED